MSIKNKIKMTTHNYEKVPEGKFCEVQDLIDREDGN